MAEALKLLAQIRLTSGTLTDIYTVPANTTTIVNKINVVNTNSSNITFRLSIAVGGAADDLKQYLYYDENIFANTSFVEEGKILLSVGDVIRAYVSPSNASITVFGMEIT